MPSPAEVPEAGRCIYPHKTPVSTAGRTRPVVQTKVDTLCSGSAVVGRSDVDGGKKERGNVKRCAVEMEDAVVGKRRRGPVPLFVTVSRKLGADFKLCPVHEKSLEGLRGCLQNFLR